MTVQSLIATPSRDADGNIRWVLCDKQCNGPPSYRSTVLGLDSGPATFTITINDIHNLGIVFAKDTTDPNAPVNGNGAMWIQPGTDCPQQSVFDTNGQIGKVTRMSDKQIAFTDLNNQTNGTLNLKYQLNFMIDGQPVTPLDPIIQNGGCCHGLMQPGATIIPNNTATFLAELALVFFIGVILTLAVQRMTRNFRDTPQNRP
jgi:hypothetical protein